MNHTTVEPVPYPSSASQLPVRYTSTTMLLTMPLHPRNTSSSTPIFSFDFTQLPATPYSQSSSRQQQQPQHRPSVSSPLSSSPIRVSQSSPPYRGGAAPSSPLSPRDINTLPRNVQSSPVHCSSFASIFCPLGSEEANNNNNRFSKYASRNAKPNPLRQTRETAQDSRRKLFLKNVRQRADDRSWERRGGDQEVLRLEWAVLDKKRRQQKDADRDGILFEDDIEDEPQHSSIATHPSFTTNENPFFSYSHSAGMGNDEEMMADAMALEEQRELDAMLSLLEPQSSTAPTDAQRPPSPSMLSDDEYDDLFMDLVSEDHEAGRSGGGAWPPFAQAHHASSQDFVCSGEMDMS
ncbi:hypothetical protein MN608_07738 [Microdochium nivale]|nr:hypothetical protein MN608_07738 [Microdochium nivale]